MESSPWREMIADIFWGSPTHGIVISQHEQDRDRSVAIQHINALLHPRGGPVLRGDGHTGVSLTPQNHIHAFPGCCRFRAGAANAQRGHVLCQSVSYATCAS